jgi:hypothetical protein
VVGPNAIVKVWDEYDFYGNAREFGPRDWINDLDDISFGDTIKSMTIEYVDALPSSVCWVEIFEDDDFSKNDNSDKIYGPGEWWSLCGINGAKLRSWMNQIDSLKVGPGAKVILYPKTHFKGEPKEFGPGRIIRDLDEYDIGDDAESMKIICIHQ